ncbi:MAG: fumarate hydratase, partial [Cellulosilyticum sp.]|nr:fumarate hydratase [Cellulosilyticum sp.]
MRSIQVKTIIEAVKELCMQANYDLPVDIFNALQSGKEKEISPVGQAILEDICQNAELATTERMP